MSIQGEVGSFLKGIRFGNTTPQGDWRERRDALIPEHGGKHMDKLTLGPDERAVYRAIWQAYNLMIKEPKKRYIGDRIAEDFSATLDLKERTNSDESLIAIDLGCGNGGMTRPLITSAYERAFPSVFVLVDRSPAALETAYEEFQKFDGFEPSEERMMGQEIASLRRKGQSGSEQTLHLVQADITDLRLPPGLSADVLTSINVLHHLRSDQIAAVLNKVDEVLRSGGNYIIEDTAQLPENLVGKHIIPFIIRKAVSLPTMEKLAREQGIDFDDILRKGAELFIHDAQRAFAQALSLPQLVELIQDSELGKKSDFSAETLKSPHPFFKHVFPPLNYITGKMR